MQGSVTIDEALCKGCGLCTNVCPKHVLRISSERITARGYRPAELDDPTGACTGCVLCATICPEAAITVYRAQAAA